MSKQKTMYVWKLTSNKHGGLTMTASTQMRELDTMRYHRAKDDNIELAAFVNYLRKTYLTKHKGDITVSEYASYAECMEHLAQQGDIQFETQTMPTQH
jgi:hypothetical protein